MEAKGTFQRPLANGSCFAIIWQIGIAEGVRTIRLRNLGGEKPSGETGFGPVHHLIYEREHN
jgi:hypothetical protein